MNEPTQCKSAVEILLVEDEPGDVELTRQGFAEGRIPSNLHVVRDVDEALSFVRREPGFADAPRPDLVLLDLNMPRRGGRELLEVLKFDPQLRRIPVIVLTTSANRDDVSLAYDLHANAYVTKPVDFDSFIKLIKGVVEFWFVLAQLPSGE